MELLPFLQDFLRKDGPLALGWVVAGYLLKFILDRYKEDIEARVALAKAIELLTIEIKSGKREK